MSVYFFFQECITENMINGRRLLHIDASHLPNIGVTDFEHIKVRTGKHVYEPRYEKTNNHHHHHSGSRTGPTQTGLYKLISRLEA